ncbi:MAG TPA: HD domain-containing phosphohydrolase [Planctomycetota bacterium]
MIGEDRDALPRLIPVGRLKPRGFAVRADPTPEEVGRLAASIRKHGLLHPILVRPAGRAFEVVCGQRRLLACRFLGWGEVPAVVRELDDRQALEVSLVENARRDPLSTADRELARGRLEALFPGRAPAELAAWLGPAAKPDEALPGWVETMPAVPPPIVEEGELPLPPPPPDPVAAPVLEGIAPPSLEEPSIVVAPPGTTVRRTSLVSRARTLLNKLAKSGVLDVPLLNEAVEEILNRLVKGPLPDFLDLRYPPRTKRYLTRHCVNVAKLAVFLGREIGLPRNELELVAVCGLLHDVGMMRVKDDVFTKHAALDQAEWEQVKGHPIEGSLLLTKEVVLRDVVARVALEHHERADGSGYPAGKRKEDTHVYARIINVVDTYAAMVSPRAHRLPHLPYDAMRIVTDSGAKGMLDWELVNAFVRAMSIYPVGSYVKLEGGEIARVIRAQPEIPEKPIIAVVADAQRNMLPVPVEIDLAMTEPMPKFTPIASPA